MFGKRLKELRGQRTQEDIAKHLGVSRARYAHYENGRSEPDYETLEKIASFFDVSIDYLLGRTDEPKEKKGGNNKLADLDENVYGLARNIQDLDPESQDLLFEMVEFMKKKGREAKEG
jgi:transcriptional regulator with XRE-family HTH domain